MITSNIGKIFLSAYNEEYGTSYDAKTFFLEQFYPLFFDQNKYMMTAGNSPLENPKLSWDDMIKGKKPYEASEQRKVRFDKLIKRVIGTDKHHLDKVIQYVLVPIGDVETDFSHYRRISLDKHRQCCCVSGPYSFYCLFCIHVRVQCAFCFLFER